MKKFKFLFLSLFCFCFFSNVHAQKLNLGTIERGSKKYVPKVLGEDEKYIYVTGWSTQYRTGDVQIEAYDKTNNNIRKYAFPIKHEKIKGQFVRLVSTVLIKDEVLAFYSYFDKKAKKSILFVKRIDKHTGKFKGEKKELLSIDDEYGYYYGNYYIQISEDKSKILASYNLRYVLYNDEMEVLHDSKTKGLGENDYSIIDNDGSIYYIRFKDMNLYVGSFDANKDFEKWEEKINVDLEKVEDLYLHNVRLNINKKNELTVTGLVSSKAEKKEDMALCGSLYINMDRESKEVKISKYNKFKSEFLDQFKTARDIKKNKAAKVKKTFNSAKVVDKEDGGVLCIFEYYRNEGDRYSNMQYIEYGDIVIVNFSKEGDMLWANRVPKKQVFSWARYTYLVTSTKGIRFYFSPLDWRTERYFSYSSGMFNNKLILIHNDTKKNVGKNMEDKLNKFKKTRGMVTVKYEFDLKTGERKKELYSDLSKHQTIFSPNGDYQKSENSNLILFGIKGNKHSFHTYGK